MALRLVICQTKRVAWEKCLKLNHKTEKEGRDKRLSSTKSCEPSHEKESRKKIPVRTLTFHQLPGPDHWQGRSSGEELQQKL